LITATGGSSTDTSYSHDPSYVNDGILSWNIGDHSGKVFVSAPYNSVWPHNFIIVDIGSEISVSEVLIIFVHDLVPLGNFPAVVKVGNDPDDHTAHTECGSINESPLNAQYLRCSESVRG
jgi:hypothetical protein